MNGAVLAQQIIHQYGSSMPEVIAERASVQVRLGRWVPVTYGEFDRKNLVITLNKNAPLPLRAILAHELGHFFAEKIGFTGNRQAQERVAEEFAEALMNTR